MSTPTVDIQSLAPGAKVDLWVLDCSLIGGMVYRFHEGTNQLGVPVVWQGLAYNPFPVSIEGIARAAQGAVPRPTLRVSNMDGVVSGLLTTLDDLVGAKVIRKRTLAKYLDAVNFPGGVNPSADPSTAWPDEVFYVEQMTSETAEIVEFQLVSGLDMQGLRLPRRPIEASICWWWWNYKGAECGYGGALPTCNGTLADCQAHFGATVPLPFGGFPGAARVR